MYWVYDADSHVEEGEFTFQDKYWDQRYRGRRPIVVQADDLGNLCWMVDSHSFPRLMGPSPATGGNPNSKDGIPSREFRTASSVVPPRVWRSPWRAWSSTPPPPGWP